MEETKRCPSCGETKPRTFEFFYHNSRTVSGFTVYCRKCTNAKYALIRYAVTERSKEKVRDGTVTEKRCPTCGETKALDAFYGHRGNTYGKTALCKICLDAKQKARAMARKEAGLPHVQSERRRAFRMRVLCHYSGGETPFCACCHTTYLPHLTMDHINGGGAEDRKTKSSSTLYQRICEAGFPPEFQILCWSCNMAKFQLGACGCQEVRVTTALR